MTLLLFLLSALVLTLLVHNLKKQFEIKKMTNYYSQITRSTKQNAVDNSGLAKKVKVPINRVLRQIEEQVEYTGKYSVPLVISSIFLLMIIGSAVGLYLQNLFLGVVIAGVLGGLPVVHLIQLERKIQTLITKTMPAFISTLKTEVELKNRLRDSFVAMETKVSHLIKDDYKVFVSELDQNEDLHNSLYRLGARTRCIWFKFLGDIAEIISGRQNKAALVRALDDLSTEIEKYILEMEANQQLVKRSGWFLVMMLGIMAASMFMVGKFISDPLNYFTLNPDGKKQLVLGVLFLLIPIITYFYRVYKREVI